MGPATGHTSKPSLLNDSGSSIPIVKLWHSLRKSPVFRALFSDRVALHTAPGGALSPQAAIDRWDTLNAFIESAVVGESARWGDSLQSLGGKYAVTRTRDIDWYNQVDKIRGILKGNTQTLLDQLSAAGFYTQQPTPPVAPSPIASPVMAPTPVTQPIAAPVSAPVAMPILSPTPPTIKVTLKLIDISQGTKTVLADGDSFSLSSMGPKFSVEAVVSGSVDSVQFDYNGAQNFRTEGVVPYALCGDTAGIFKACTILVAGQHTVKATPFLAGSPGTPVSVTFTIVAN